MNTATTAMKKMYGGVAVGTQAQVAKSVIVGLFGKLEKVPVAMMLSNGTMLCFEEYRNTFKVEVK